jgi:hypothetical protein
MEADAAVRHGRWAGDLDMRGGSAMGVTVRTPGPLSTKPAVIGRTPACMTRPPFKSLFTNWQRIYLRKEPIHPSYWTFWSGYRIFCAPASGKRSSI